MKIIMTLNKIICNCFVLLFVFTLVFSCSNAQKPPKFLNELSSIEDFKTLDGKPLSKKYGEVDAIKVVYDIKNDVIYYLNSKNYKYHHGFCSKKLNHTEGLETFNANNYSESLEKRDFLLGNINYYNSIKQYVMDLSPADLIQLKEIETLHKKIANSVYFKDFKLLLNTSRLINLKDSFSIPTITPEEIYKNQKFQPLSTNSCYGYLRLVTLNDLKTKTFKPNDIIVLEQTPNIIPLVAGVIASEFQTPLSHLSILGKNRSIPIMAYKDAFNYIKFTQYKDSYIKLTVRENSFYMQRVDTSYTNKNRRKSVVNIKKDLSIDTLVSFDVLKQVRSKSVGNKARNFAVLQKLSNSSDFKVPEHAFAIPFYFYEKHLESSKAGIIIEQLLEDMENMTAAVNIEKRLKYIRKAIKQTPIDKQLIASVEQQLKNENGYTRFRFRSSTNAEDMEGFSGAGLYKSKTAVIGDSIKTVEKAIQKVWASLWNLQAFNEREYFNINQQKVAMGILVHRSFPNEIANGVAITKNIYRESNLGMVINVQLGNESVVEPSKGVICDQVVCYESGTNKIYTEKDIVEVITKSSLNNNQLIMTDKEIINLCKQLEIIKKYYFRNSGEFEYNKFGLDVEFKLDTDNRTLYIKQVRHYNG